MNRILSRIESLTTTTQFHQACWWITNKERLVVGWLASKTCHPLVIDRLETLTEETNLWAIELDVCKTSNGAF